MKLLHALLAVSVPVHTVSLRLGLAEGGKYDTRCDDLTAGVGLTWHYDWSLAPQTPCAVISSGQREFVSMAWSGADVAQAPYAGSSILLGFNEPNQPSQSNMSPQQAAALWPQLEATAAAHGIARLGSPAACPCTKATCNGGDAVPWFDAFFAACGGCRVDFLATHYYGCSVSGLTGFLNSLRKYNLPIWLTEFACTDAATVTAAQHEAYMQQAIPALAGLGFVERASWMAGRATQMPGAQLFQGAAGAVSPTALGQLYLSFAATYNNASSGSAASASASASPMVAPLTPSPLPSPSGPASASPAAASPPGAPASASATPAAESPAGVPPGASPSSAATASETASAAATGAATVSAAASASTSSSAVTTGSGTASHSASSSASATHTSSATASLSFGASPSVTPSQTPSASETPSSSPTASSSASSGFLRASTVPDALPTDCSGGNTTSANCTSPVVTSGAGTSAASALVATFAVAALASLLLH